MPLNADTGFSKNQGAPEMAPIVLHCSATIAAFAWQYRSFSIFSFHHLAPDTDTSVHGGNPATNTTLPDRMTSPSSSKDCSMVADSLRMRPSQSVCVCCGST